MAKIAQARKALAENDRLHEQVLKLQADLRAARKRIKELEAAQGGE